ncbi:SRPBCC domain-containing protein [Diaminobutyricimonas sp. LJ205]|uniref:SRPBCC domain-containing protein n=1 Tax=Diaminobutyricimonas sp. LJ205 TaxID=2683590 RepID=UPI0012F49B34|nr:SRPBCC domain-containing protein [Diaminobutyricimonas sp. LJ205]
MVSTDRRGSGFLAKDSQGLALTLSRAFDAKAFEVWPLLTESTLLGKWIGTWTGRAGVGKTIAFVMTEEGDDPEMVTILGCDPPRYMVLELGAAGGGTWRLAVTLIEQDGNTTLTLQHYLHPSDALAEIGPGWDYYLDRLAAVWLGDEMPIWDDYYPALVGYYEKM